MEPTKKVLAQLWVLAVVPEQAVGNNQNTVGGRDQSLRLAALGSLTIQDSGKIAFWFVWRPRRIDMKLPRNQQLPRRVRLLRRLPALSRLPGQSPAQLAAYSALESTLMIRTQFATIVRAVASCMPRMEHNRRTACPSLDEAYHVYWKMLRLRGIKLAFSQKVIPQRLRALTCDRGYDCLPVARFI